MTLGLVDTHCHLYMEAFAGEEEAILRRAREKGVQRLLVPGIDLESSEQAVALAMSHPEVYAAVGVHPHSAMELDGSTVRSLEDLARQPKVLAIGEIGLDFYRDRSPRPVQEAAFQQQLELACRLGLPVVVHCREAMETLLPTLIAWKFETCPKFCTGAVACCTLSPAQHSRQLAPSRPASTSAPPGRSRIHPPRTCARHWPPSTRAAC